MAVSDRQSGSRNWAPSFFAFFWILLAGFSTLYLVGLFVDPPAHGDDVIASSTPVPPAPQGDSDDDSQTAEQVAALAEANDARGQDLDTVKTAMRDLSHKMEEFNTRLKPIEKILGPVAALPPAASVTTSPPTPGAMQPAAPVEAEMPAATPEPPMPLEKPKAVEAPPKPVEPPKPAVATPKPVEEPKPTVASPKPDETPVPEAHAALSEPESVEGGAEGLQGETSAPAPAVETAAPPAEEPEATSVAAASPGEDPMAGERSDPSPSTDDTSAAAEATPTEIAKFDPVALPPAANDGSTRFGIEIGSTDNQNGLRPLWREYLSKHAALVAGLQPRRVLAPDKKWRLIAGPFSNAVEAAQACVLFKKAERPCEATVYAGDAL